jgi:uncharacterized protein
MILREKDRLRLIDFFESINMPIEVWAYGSRVNGGAHDASDLDLVIRTATLQAMPIDVFVNLKETIRDSNIPIIVDLFDWARLPEVFHRNILKRYEVLYSSL